MKHRTQKLLSLFLAAVMVVGLFPTSALAALAPKADPPALSYRLTAGEQNGNGHFGSTEPEAFVLSQQNYTNESFSFVLKLNSENAKTRFRFVTKYVSDTEWGYVGYDGASGWFYEFKTGGSGNWPALTLPKLSDGAQVKLSGTYAEDGLHLVLEDLSTGVKSEAVANDPAFLSLKAQSGKVGFGAAKYGAEITDVTVSGLTVGGTVYDDAAYKAMALYQDKVGSWAPVADSKPEPQLITWARLVSGEGNGNGHFGSATPEAFVLTPETYTNEGFSFVVKFNSETNDTRFRLVTKYIDDSNWSYIAFDGYQGKNHWFTEYKDNGTGGWPDLSGLPVLNKGDEVKFTGVYEGAGLKLTVENLTTGKTGSAIVSHEGIKAASAGQVGFGAGQWGTAATDISVRDLVIGEKVYDKDAYEAMEPYKNLVGSWTVEQVKPADPNEGKLWYRITTGSKNTNSHNYGDASKNAPALALDQSQNMTVGKTVSMTIKPSENFAMFYTYLDDNNWLYIGYDKSSGWYYQFKIPGSEQYPSIPGLPVPVVGKELTMSVALDRETLSVTVNDKTVRIPDSRLLPFSEQESLKTGGHFGIKTMGTLDFTDAMLGTADAMAHTWAFAADRDGQALTQVHSVLYPLSGIVRDQEGSPIANASVNVGTKRAKTDAAGAYTVNGLELGEYTIAVSAPGFTSHKETVTIVESEPNVLDITLEPKADLDLTKFDSITDGSTTVYIGKSFPVIARYVRSDGSFFRANEDAALMDSFKINGTAVTPAVEILKTEDNLRDYGLTIKNDAKKLDLTMTVRISVAEGDVTWQVTDLTKNQDCAPIAALDFTDLNPLSVSVDDKDACFDGAVSSSNTMLLGDRHATFEDGFYPGSDPTFYLYAFLTNGVLSAGLESNSCFEGDKRIMRTDSANAISLNSNVFYYEQGDVNGQKYVAKHPSTVYPTCELPCIKVAMGGDLNKDGTIDWNDGALAYRDIMHMAYENEVIKDLVNYRVVMNFASMHPNPYLQTADNLKKVYLATDGLPQALLLKGYGNEGHDSANSEYADIAERQGGVEDFQKLIRIAHDYNTEIGVHINAQEAYPESKSFCPEMIGGPVGTGTGWGWLDQSHIIDKYWDLASGARWQRLVQFYDRINNTHHLNLDWDKGEYVMNAQGIVDATREAMKKEGEALPNNLDFIYLDVWYQDSWESREIANMINSLGWRFSTEFSTSCEYDSTWQHWATDAPYGGAGMKGFNSDIIRFIRNDQRDSQVLNYPSYGGTADNPLLGGFQLSGFEGWVGQRDFGKYILATFNDNLPTRFLQHYIVTDWENYAEGQSPVGNHEKQITLANENGDTVVVTRKPDPKDQRDDDNIERTITLNGKVVLDDVTYLLPWTDNQDGSEKLYHWNLEGGETTWTLQNSWAALDTLTVYKLTDQGRVEPQTVPVVDGTITLNAEKATPYVLVPAAGVKTLKHDFGEMDYVTDPGFNGYAPGSKLDKADWSGDIDDPSVTVEVSKTGDQRLQFASPEKDVAVSTTIRNLIPGKDYVAEIYVQNDTNLPATLEVDAGKKVTSVWAGHSYVLNYVRCDNKSAYSSMQRMQVSFVAEADTAVLTLKRAAGEGNTYMDCIRIVQKKLDNYQPDGSFKQDFESVVQGLYPFVLGPAQDVDDPRTHLSELHAPYTQYGWNDRVVDDVIDGEWSLKHHSGSAGIIYQTLPQNFRFEPGKIYNVEFDYQTGSDRAYAMVVGDDDTCFKPAESELLPVTGGKTLEDGTVVGNTQHVKMVVQGAEDGNTWIGLYCANTPDSGAFGQTDFILDNLVIREDEHAVSVKLSATQLYKGETASIVVRTADPNGGITSWDNTDPKVAAVDGDTIKALSAGSTVLTAHLSDGNEAAFNITVLDEAYLGLHGASVTANTQETTGEPEGNGIAAAASDGDSSTYWHTQWQYGSFKVTDKNPAILTVDLGGDFKIDGIKFQQRASGQNGKVMKYSYSILDKDQEVLTSCEPTVVPKAQQADGAWTEIRFSEPLSDAHYIEFKIYGGNNNFGALAEIQAIYHLVVSDKAVVDPVTVRIDESASASVKSGTPDTVLKGIVLSSSDPSVFTVDDHGKILPKKPGEAKLIASNCAGVYAEAKVTVIGIQSVELTTAPDYILPDAELDPAAFAATVHYTDKSTKNVSGTVMELAYDDQTHAMTGSYMGVELTPKPIREGVTHVSALIKAPVPGQKPAASVEAKEVSISLTWEGALTADGTFDYATVYTARLSIKAKDGYALTSNTVIDGADVDETLADGTILAHKTFEATCPAPVITEETVTFKVVNGTWDDGSTEDKTVTVTLTDGKGTLPPPMVPTGMKASKGYEGGAWDVTPNTGTDAITGSVTYTYTFSKKIINNPFTDVHEDDWFYTPVLWAVDNGVTAGVSKTEFAPGQNCSRAQAIVALWKAVGQPAPKTKVNPFTDVKEDDWFFEAVLWAVDSGVTAGISSSQFGPALACSRAQAMTFLWKASGMPDSKSEVSFTDVTENDWFYKPVCWAVENGITAGVSPDAFGSFHFCLRAHLVTFLYLSAQEK